MRTTNCVHLSRRSMCIPDDGDLVGIGIVGKGAKVRNTGEAVGWATGAPSPFIPFFVDFELPDNLSEPFEFFPDLSFLSGKSSPLPLPFPLGVSVELPVPISNDGGSFPLDFGAFVGRLEGLFVILTAVGDLVAFSGGDTLGALVCFSVGTFVFLLDSTVGALEPFAIPFVGSLVGIAPSENGSSRYPFPPFDFLICTSWEFSNGAKRLYSSMVLNGGLVPFRDTGREESARTSRRTMPIAANKKHIIAVCCPMVRNVAPGSSVTLVGGSQDLVVVGGRGSSRKLWLN